MMQRVMIMGQPGSGKSTLARALGEVTGLPVFHMDQIHWMPGWLERPMEVRITMTAEVHAKPEWIFEGGFSRSWDVRLARADTLIWLDVDWPVRAWRVFRRTLKAYGQSRPDLPENCPERFSFEFYKWIWDTRHKGRAMMRRRYEAAVDLSKYRFTSFAQVDAFVEDLKA